MPELPDIVVYIEALKEKTLGRTLERIQLGNPFLLRSVQPPIAESHGRKVTGFRRMGKRIVIELEGDLFLVIHLMIAGRLRWKPTGTKLPRKLGLALFEFADGVLMFTEAGSKKRASLYLVEGEAGLADHDRGGLEVLEADVEAFGSALRREKHTLKRSLTDPRILSGVGNAYSDEILHRAQLSPFKLTDKLSDEEIRRLFDATRAILTEWTDRLREKTGGKFPDKVTAFHDEMAAHGRYRKPCPVCETPIQRIVYSSNESNYCPTCQTGGKLLADRALSRLLKKDWPKTLEELEERRSGE